MTRSLLSGFAVALCATGVLLSMQGIAQADGWQVSKVSGEAWETASGTHKPLSVGTTLDESATIVTGERSRVMLVRRTETMVVGPVSVVAISEHPDQQLSTTVLQKGGTVTFDVEKRNVQHFSVETPMLAAVVKGTHFTVVVGRATGNVSVDRGTVQVTALATGQTTAITHGQRAAVDQRGLSTSGQGRPASISRTEPRAALVSPISEVTPATTVSVGEFAAAQQQQQAPQAPASNPGLVSETMSLFSATPFGSVANESAAASNTAIAAFSESGDRSGHTSASTPASGNTTPSRSAGGPGTGIGGNGTATAGTMGSMAASQTGSSQAANGGSSAAVGSSTQGSSGGVTSANGSASTGSAGSSGSASQVQGNAGTFGNGGSNGVAGSAGSTGKSDQGQGNGGTPGNGGVNGGGSPGSSGKSDQGKGNGGTPGNGGVNGGGTSSGNSGKSDQGKGNGGTPGNGHGDQS